MFIQFFIVAAFICQSLSLIGTYSTTPAGRTFHVHLTRKSVWGVPYEISHKIFCGGSIITERWILTGAYCVFNLPSYSQIEVLAGKGSFNYYRFDPEQQNRVVTKIYIHPLYPGLNSQHDIALLKVNESFIFNNYVQPVNLPNQNETYNGTARVTGAGSISRNKTVVMPKVLQYEDVPVIDYKICRNIMEKAGIELEIFDTQLCSNSNSASTCIGDSGSPLFGEEKLIGIVSWGVFPCGIVSGTSVYTKVSNYTNWIYNTMRVN